METIQTYDNGKIQIEVAEENKTSVLKVTVFDAGLDGSPREGVSVLLGLAQADELEYKLGQALWELRRNINRRFPPDVNYSVPKELR